MPRLLRPMPLLPMAVSEADLSDAGRVAGTADAVRLLAPLLCDPERERLVCLALDRRGRPVGCEVLTIGSDVHCIVDPRQVLRWALTRTRAAVAIVLSHSHPSGDPTPSDLDRDVTRRMAAACDAVGLQLLDHLVLGVGKPLAWASFAERGELPASMGAVAIWTA